MKKSDKDCSALKTIKAHILIVYQECDFSRKLALFLESQSYKVETVSSLEDVESELDTTKHYDLIISSTQINKKNLFLVLELVKFSNIYASVFFISDKPSLKECVYALKNGADNYLDQNYSFEEILNEIELSVKCISNTPENKKNILFVKHKDCFIELNEQLAEEYNICEVDNYNDALSVYYKNSCHLILCDISIVEENQFDFIRKVKYNKYENEVIFFTDKPKVNEAISAMKLGAFNYFEKGLSISKIKAIVKKAFLSLETKRQYRVPDITSPNVNDNPHSSKRYGKYKAIRTIGVGASGMVILVENNRRNYALKLLRMINRNDERALIKERRFYRESNILFKLNHPGIVKVIETGVTDKEKLPYMVMEYVEGKSLKHFIYNKTLSNTTKIDILIQIAIALKEVHKVGIVHRDIKPENILITENFIAKITDFGISTADDLTAIVNDRDTAGTPRYMAPECFVKEPNITLAADIFSFGVLTYELITGSVPFDGDTIPQIVASICNDVPRNIFTRLKYTPPIELQMLIEKTLCKNVKERYQSMNLILKDLKEVKKYYLSI